MGRPTKKTTQATLRIEDGVAERTARVTEALLKREPHLRPFVTSLPAMYRLLLERGLNAYEAELGLAAPPSEPPAAPPPPAAAQPLATPPRRPAKPAKAVKR